MMRSIWSGSISFGLINIPIRLYSATDEHLISFTLLHKDDLSPIRYARICTEEEKEIPYEHIVKGYEYEKGEFVVVEEEDFKRASAQKTGLIEIVNFSKESEVDSIYFEKPYYLEPDKGADKAYALLREALRKANKLAIVKYVFKNKAQLGAIKPSLDVLILDQMRFADEIRNTEGLKLPQMDEVGKKEIEMALKLIDQLTEKFNINAYHDMYREKLQEVIEDKIKGQALPKVGKAPKPSKIHDIMSLLKASLEEPRQKKGRKKEKRETGTKG
jgi:DNA end-binding protein Ku